MDTGVRPLLAGIRMHPFMNSNGRFCKEICCARCGKKRGKTRNHLKERLLDQAQVRMPYTPPRHDIEFPTLCKLIILPNKTIPQGIF